MPKTLKVRQVPDELRQTLSAHAAERGMTLSEHVISELEAIADQPTLAELSERISMQEPMDIGNEGAEIIRRHRGPLP